ncbi:phosphate ABC transporter substrate-binding protein PstS [Actinoplanes friuliensis]|uniref:Phosphate-binding protein n=1 Tax=Actinoplanes friuliensis DSM 7358 TaxID=1246995 RepID=U5W1N2_9ACTN|nr:phosphate ABC transporter substrate-binding protein PstS [Actinoplanes friuliensis]AGZ41890.1 putative phosphate ABC transporter substrate-binding protein [Actinoplanes friuliensis DSM 7358]
MRFLPVLLVALVAGCGTSAATATGAEGISCAAGSITAQGSSAQTTVVSAWIKGYQIACPEATIAYASTGSGAGVRAFGAGTGDFVGTDSVLSGEGRRTVGARCPAVHLPLVVGPIALAYNVAGVGGLQLRPATVAKIFAGVVTVWNDPAVVADNPGVTLPSTKIRTVHRKDNSGTTDNFTRFLTAAGGADWKFGAGSVWSAPGGSAEQGSNGVATAIARTDGAIGYVEGSYARFHQLATARIGNGAGEFAVLTDEAAALTIAGARVSGTGGDLRLTVDHRVAAPGAYPIVLVTYEVVCGKGSPALVRSFLAYAASPAGQAAAARLGYAPLPEKLRAQVVAAINRL